MNVENSSESLPNIPPGYDALLRIAGGEADRGTIAAEHLIAILGGLQQLAFVLAKAQTGETLGERLTLKRALRQQFALRCGLPVAGSYALPLTIGDGNELPLEQPRVLEQVQEFWEALAGENHTALIHLLAEPFRSRALRECYRLVKPLGQSRLYFDTRAKGSSHALTQRSARFIDTLLTRNPTEDAVMTVTGELQRIDFAARQLTILYPPTRREILCTYLPEIEDDLLEARKEPIQVTGRFVLDEEGNPLRLTDVNRIEPLDLSPLMLVELESERLRLKTPLEWTPTLDEESQQYLCIEDPNLGLNVFALNREQLQAEILAQIDFLWDEYACAPDAELNTEALALKTRLLAALEDSSMQGAPDA